MFVFRNCFLKRLIEVTVPGIKPVITGHFKMFFRNVLNEELDEIQCGQRSANIGIILMLIVMKGNLVTIVGINTRSSNDGPAEVAADVFNNRVRVTKIGLGIDVKTIFIVMVTSSFELLERRTKAFEQEIKENRLKSGSKVFVIEISDRAPKAIIREAAFRKETVDMRIPGQGPSECMKNTNETRNKVFTFIEIMEQLKKDTANRDKQEIK